MSIMLDSISTEIPWPKKIMYLEIFQRNIVAGPAHIFNRESGHLGGVKYLRENCWRDSLQLQNRPDV